MVLKYISRGLKSPFVKKTIQFLDNSIRIIIAILMVTIIFINVKIYKRNKKKNEREKLYRRKKI